MKIESILKLVKTINKEFNSSEFSTYQLDKTYSTLNELWSIKKEEVKEANKNETWKCFKVKVCNSKTETLNENLQEIHQKIYSCFSSASNVTPILQGSTADNTFHPGWSDIDLIILIDSPCKPEQIKKIKESISDCKKYIEKVQPLQHHGVFMMPRPILSFYPESFMPPQALYRSVSNREFQLSFKTCLQPKVFKKILEDRLTYTEEAVKSRYYTHHCYKSVPLALDNVKDCPYQLFAYINYLFLVPSIYKSANCKSQYKGDTLRNLDEMSLSKPILVFIDKLNRLRDQWIKIGYREDILEVPLDERIVETLGCEFWTDAYLYEKYFYERARECIERVN